MSWNAHRYNRGRQCPRTRYVNPDWVTAREAAEVAELALYIAWYGGDFSEYQAAQDAAGAAADHASRVIPSWD